MKCCSLLVFLLLTFSGFAQVADTTQPPYKRFPTIPPIQVLMSDSATMYTKAAIPKNKPLMILLFSPDCNHCQHEAEELHRYREEMKEFQILLITMHPFARMKDFIVSYKLNELPNVVVGQDVYFTLPAFFGIRNLPFHALYNKKGDLVLGFEGSMEMPKVIQALRN